MNDSSESVGSGRKSYQTPGGVVVTFEGTDDSSQIWLSRAGKFKTFIRKNLVEMLWKFTVRIADSNEREHLEWLDTDDAEWLLRKLYSEDLGYKFWQLDQTTQNEVRNLISDLESTVDVLSSFLSGCTMFEALEALDSSGYVNGTDIRVMMRDISLTGRRLEKLFGTERIRKCPNCGTYFISRRGIKYCDNVPPGETEACRWLVKRRKGQNGKTKQSENDT